MQEPRLTARGSRGQLPDGVQVGRSPLEGSLALVYCDQLEANRIAGPALRQNRKVGLADNGDLRIAAHGRRISHQGDRHAVARDLDGAGTTSFGWQRSKGFT